MVESKYSDNVDTESSESNCSVDLPENCCPLVHQVAGHFYGQGRTKLGLLQTNDGLILKPEHNLTGEREHNFYKRIFKTNDAELNEDEIDLRKLLPIYYGSFLHNDIVYIKMEDKANGFKYPAVIDFKLGRITHDPIATPEKIHRHRSRYPPAEKLGFQLLGMRVFDKKENTFTHYDKIFGRSLDEANLIHGLALFYQFHQTPQIRAIKETIRRFEEVKQWFEKQRTYHFYASSLICIYEAYYEEIYNKLDVVGQQQHTQSEPNRVENSFYLTDSNNSMDANNNSNDICSFDYSNSFKMFMADFAHVFPANNQIDRNYLDGLDNLIQHLKTLLNPNYKFKDLRVLN